MRQRSDVARNRQAILRAATLLYQQVDDVTAITMDDIAAAAGVGKGTVFRRFGDRAGLLRAVFDEQIEPGELVTLSRAGLRSRCVTGGA
jgi:AcrR family transcriptional regulator